MRKIIESHKLLLLKLILVLAILMTAKVIFDVNNCSLISPEYTGTFLK